MVRLAFLLVFAIVALAPAAGVATQQGILTLKRWQASDKCAMQAQQAYPDYTAEANAKRDAQLKACLAGQNLPPREPLSPPAPQQATKP